MHTEEELTIEKNRLTETYYKVNPYYNIETELYLGLTQCLYPENAHTLKYEEGYWALHNESY